jgi:hypothetical protein
MQSIAVAITQVEPQVIEARDPVEQACQVFE